MPNQRIPPIRLKIAQTLLYIGLLGVVGELVLGHRELLVGGMALAMTGAVLGLNRVVCSRCRYMQTQICANAPMCSVCGAAIYADNQ